MLLLVVEARMPYQQALLNQAACSTPQPQGILFIGVVLNVHPQAPNLSVAVSQGQFFTINLFPNTEAGKKGWECCPISFAKLVALNSSVPAV